MFWSDKYAKNNKQWKITALFSVVRFSAASIAIGVLH